jgi:2-hydroxychromene-2-carboxylate isomerase
MAKIVDVYYSNTSPWTYLGWQRFRAIASKAGATVHYWPVDFGKVFSVSGGLPLKQRPVQRQAYRMMELKRWRAHLGIPLNLEPKFFPTNESLAAHMAIAVRRRGLDIAEFSHAVLRGCWAEEKDISDPATLVALADALGMDGKALLAEADSAPVKAERERDNQRAIELQVFGAPTFIIDGELFWGQDRLDFVARKLGTSQM